MSYFQHDFPFDPTYGWDTPQLLEAPVPEGPADFAEFWQATYEETLASPLRLRRWPLKSPDPRFSLQAVKYDSLDGVRIGGWLAIPVEGPITRGVVIGHGYGGRGGPDFAGADPHAAMIFPCARGFDRSRHPVIPGDASAHVVFGIQSRETYCHRGCVADFWRAACVLTRVVPVTAECLDYAGGSFGGGIGALMLPWDKRFRRAHLDVPSFGNIPLRITLPCAGSGAAITELYNKRPEILNVLQYFDAATAATYLRIPVLVGAAVFDPAVPPPGQFAVYNGLAGTKQLYIRKAAHFTHGDETKEWWDLHNLQQTWFER